MSAWDFLSGEVSEKTTYQPVRKDAFRGKIVDAEITDPAALGWTVREDLTLEQRLFATAPFGRIRVQILTDAMGNPVPEAGRIVDGRVSFVPGFNPKTGRSNLEVLADLIRVKHGLTRQQEVIGYKLFETVASDGMDRKDYITESSRRFKEGVLNLELSFRVGHVQIKGEAQDRLVKIIVPKGE